MLKSSARATQCSIAMHSKSLKQQILTRAPLSPEPVIAPIGKFDSLPLRLVAINWRKAAPDALARIEPALFTDLGFGSDRKTNRLSDIGKPQLRSMKCIFRFTLGPYMVPTPNYIRGIKRLST
jgi:hypothetical protein